jgi:tryptophan synthase alpha chain
VERRIDEILGGARAAGKTVLTPYLCAGFPDSESLEPMLAACEHAGCPLAILGFPHALPIFEGSDIAAGMRRALAAGMRLDAIFEQTRRARAVGAVSGKFGLVAAVSATVLARASEAGQIGFMRRAKSVGIDAVLVVDVPLEEIGPFRVAADEAGVQLGMLVSAAASQPRMTEIAKIANGFVLLVARASNAAASEFAGAVARLRSVTQLPILAGMDAATVSHVRNVTAQADGVVVAGFLARRVADARGKQAGEVAGEYLRELASGLSPARSPGGAA